jgi:hypothetical protein
MPLDEVATGFFLGLMVGEGHFGGDGRQPQVTLRMHTRHEALFRWLVEAFPGSKLYGPYEHGGRTYFQWMARGAVLREQVVPLIAEYSEWLDDYAAGRFRAMCENYRIPIAPPGASGSPPPATAPPA